MKPPLSKMRSEVQLKKRHSYLRKLCSDVVLKKIRERSGKFRRRRQNASVTYHVHVTSVHCRNVASENTLLAPGRRIHVARIGLGVKSLCLFL